MNKLEIPVVISHFNQQPNYLKFALKSAANFNKNVVLLGDNSNKGFWENHWNVTSIESEKYQAFQKYYVQMSYYPKTYEDSFWKRMFMLEEWMKKNDAKQAFLLDSDVMTFSNYSIELAPILFDNYIASLMTCENQDNFRWASSCHFSYWTLEGITDFTTFSIEAYSNQEIRKQLEAKWQWHNDNNQAGGVSEMTLLYLWSKDNPRVANSSKVANDMTIDHSINTSTNYLEDEYQMQLGIKKIIFKNGIPYGFNKVLNKEIRFLCIHCQGTAKILMRFFYDENLRPFYLVAKFVEIIKTTTKLFIEKLNKKG
jgi:hypothetical protein